MSAPALTLHIVTLFPSLFDSWLDHGVASRAIDAGLIAVDLVPLREFGVGRHLVTDDYPFGGGPGMVLKPEPIFAAVESLNLPPGTPVLLMSPRGKQFRQRDAEELSRQSRVVLVAGHYEGVDQRVIDHLITGELSIGDYVLSSGELAATVVADAAARLVPGAITEGGAQEESFSSGLLEYPQYTRPADFRGWTVPEVLLSGNHAAIARWRHEEALHMTESRRPDLLTARDPDGSVTAQGPPSENT